MTEKDKTLQITIKSARVNAGLTQDQAAEALGVDKSTLVRWEKDSTNIPVCYIVKMVDLYGIAFEHFYFGKSAN